jgi:hypothetical protein
MTASPIPSPKAQKANGKSDPGRRGSAIVDPKTWIAPRKEVAVSGMRSCPVEWWTLSDPS